MTPYITATQVATTIRGVLERCEAQLWVKALSTLVADFAISFFPDSPDAQRAFIRQCTPGPKVESGELSFGEELSSLEFDNIPGVVEEAEQPAEELTEEMLDETLKKLREEPPLSIQCCYLRPSPNLPRGDYRRPCEAEAVWAIWENGTHPSQVTYACDVHLPQLLGTTGGSFEFHVWPVKVELGGEEDESLFSEPDPKPLGYFASTMGSNTESLEGFPGADNLIKLSDYLSPDDREDEEEIPFYEKGISPDEASRLLREYSPCRDRAEALDALEKALRSSLEVVLAMQRGR